MALGSTQHLTEMSTKNLFWWIKGGRRVRLTTLGYLSADCLETEASTSRNPMGLHGLLQLYLLLLCDSIVGQDLVVSSVQELV
jgi:hypothetical protein